MTRDCELVPMAEKRPSGENHPVLTVPFWRESRNSNA